MKNQTIKFRIVEPTFGASTEVEVTTNKLDVVLFVSDTSTHETNYTWDYIPTYFKKCVGKTIEEFRNCINKANINLLKGQEFRHPEWIEVK